MATASSSAARPSTPASRRFKQGMQQTRRQGNMTLLHKNTQRGLLTGWKFLWRLWSVGVNEWQSPPLGHYHTTIRRAPISISTFAIINYTITENTKHISFRRL
jgi:hypothetical protein